MKIDEAIDDLYTILGQHNGEYMDYASYEAAVDNLNIISNFVAGTRWIPVSERLPAPFQGVLISNGQWVEFALWGCRVARYKKNYQLCKSATHWMQSPKAPEVE